MTAAGTGRAPGFTLIELIVVILVIGVLASMAMFNVSASRRSAYKAQMQTDLRYLVFSEENYYEKSANTSGDSQYSDLLTQLEYTPTDGVTFLIEANTSGWSAEARHAMLPDTDFCAIFVGSISAPPPAVNPGVLACQ